MGCTAFVIRGCQGTDNERMTSPHATTTPPALHAYETLTPDVVLDALASVGLHGDGRLMALSSYENRVYQIHLENSVGKAGAAGDVVVAKFYRPDRWTDE